jgi:hypothetical protein
MTYQQIFPLSLCLPWVHSPSVVSSLAQLSRVCTHGLTLSAASRSTKAGLVLSEYLGAGFASILSRRLYLESAIKIACGLFRRVRELVGKVACKVCVAFLSGSLGWPFTSNHFAWHLQEQPFHSCTTPFHHWIQC